MRLLSLAALSLSSLSLMLAGCALSTTALPGPDLGSEIKGAVIGGRQPIVGAHVYLFSAGTSAYGGASNSLLTSGSGSDTIGEYVATDSQGNFSITGDYTCTAGAQVYLYALGGNPGSGTNSAAGLLAVLGQCPVSGSLLTTTPFVVINEISTVAAAYATAGFSVDATHISSSGTALALTGIANAFKNAASLADISTGQALVTTPAGNATVPQAEINTIANLLASCVNSIGPASTPCATLFADAKSSGSSGVTPTDTATVAINIAHNPAANVAALYGLSTGTPPFSPALSSQPSDFIVTMLVQPIIPRQLAVDSKGNVWTCGNNGGLLKFASNGAMLSPVSGYTGGGLSGTFLCRPIAIDSSDNIWVVASNSTSALLAEFSNSGTPMSGTGIIGNGLAITSNFIAIDGSDNIWVADGGASAGTSFLSKFASNGIAAAGSPFTGNGLNNPTGLAIDNSGNVWTYGTVLSKFTNAGAAATGSPFGAVSRPATSIAIDSANNVWLEGGNFAAVVKLNSNGIAYPGSPFSGGGVSASGPYSLAIDGSGNLWADSQVDPFNGPGSLIELANSGAAISPSTGYVQHGVDASNGYLVVDPSGSIWVFGEINTGSLAAISITIGAATPVVTPLSVGVKNHTLGTRP